MKWSIQDIWNNSLVLERRPIKERNHINVSEIGKNYWERFQSMKGVAHTNPFDERTLRKFAAGNYFEDLIGLVLRKTGILISSQERVEIPVTARHIRITGRLDYKAGGIVDWTDAVKRIRDVGFPEAIENICLKLVEYFKDKYPNGLDEVVYEIKTINSQVFWAKQEYLQEAYPHHIMQIYSYLKATGVPEGRIFYISKDDLTVKEIPVYLGTEELEKKWNKDVEEFSKYWRKGEEPPKPEFVIFDSRKKLKFSKNKIKYEIRGCYDINWEIDWSPYRDLIIKDFKDYDVWVEHCSNIVSEKNAILKGEFIEKLPKISE